MALENCGAAHSRARSAMLAAIRAGRAPPAAATSPRCAGCRTPIRCGAQVTSTRENCLGARCPEFSRCHVVLARREALEADIVIVNHHLLLADLALKEDGFGDLLGSADAVILDEAHQIPDLATQFFGAQRQQPPGRDSGARPARGAARLRRRGCRRRTPRTRCRRRLRTVEEALQRLRGDAAPR